MDLQMFQSSDISLNSFFSELIGNTADIKSTFSLKICIHHT